MNVYKYLAIYRQCQVVTPPYGPIGAVDSLTIASRVATQPSSFSLTASRTN